MGQDAKGFTLVVFSFEFCGIGFGLAGMPQEQDHGFLDGPFEVVVADFLIGFAGPFAVGFFYRFNQAGIGGKILDPGKASDVMDFIEDHQGQDRTDTRYGLQQKERMDVVLPGGFSRCHSSLLRISFKLAIMDRSTCTLLRT